MEPVQSGIDWGIVCTIIGTGIAIVALVHQFFRNFKKDTDEKFALLDNRIFELAMGKSLKDILKAEKASNG
jgi:hypothetical protein